MPHTPLNVRNSAEKLLFVGGTREDIEEANFLLFEGWEEGGYGEGVGEGLGGGLGGEFSVLFVLVGERRLQKK